MMMVTMILCHYCGKELSEDFYFCPYCGIRTAKRIPALDRCPDCGEKIRYDAKFCVKCGKDLSS